MNTGIASSNLGKTLAKTFDDMLRGNAELKSLRVDDSKNIHRTLTKTRSNDLQTNSSSTVSNQMFNLNSNSPSDNLKDRMTACEEEKLSIKEELQAALQELEETQQVANDLSFNLDDVKEQNNVLIECLHQQHHIIDKCCSRIDFIKTLFEEIGPRLSLDGSSGSDISDSDNEANKTPQELANDFVRKLNRLESILVYKANQEKELRSDCLETKQRLKQREVDVEHLKIQLSVEKSKRHRESDALSEVDVSDLTRRMVESKTKEKELQEEIDRLKESKRTQASKYKHEVDDLQEKFNSASERLEAALSSQQQMSVSYEALQVKNQHVQGEFDICKQTNEKLAEKLSEAEKGFEKEMSEFKKTLKDALVAVTVSDNFKIEAETKTKELSKLTKEQCERLDEREKELTTCQKLIDAISSERDNLKSECKSLQERLKKLESSSTLPHKEERYSSINIKKLRLSTARQSSIDELDSTNQPTSKVSVLSRVLSFENGNENNNSLAVPRAKFKTSPSTSSDKSRTPPVTRTTRMDLTSLLNRTSRSNGTSPAVNHINEEKSSDDKQSANFRIVSSEASSSLTDLMKQGSHVSRRNALLEWCKSRISTYKYVDVTNFSSSWGDGMAFCAILHSFLPEKIPYHKLSPSDKRHNFDLACNVASSVGIQLDLDVDYIIANERPDWRKILPCVRSIFEKFSEMISS